MAPMNGTDVLLKVQTAVGPPAVYTAVGSQRDCSISESVDEIDFSSKDQPEQKVGGGRYKSSISLDALYVPTDAAYTALKTAFRARTLVILEATELGVATEKATCLITKMDRAFPDEGECTISIDLTVSGAWTAAP